MATGRDRMLDSVNALVDGAPADEAMLIQQRPTWVWIVAIATFAVTASIGQQAGLPPVIGAGIGGGCFGAVYALSTKYFVLAGAGPHVYLCRSKALQASATEVLKTFDRPIDITNVNSIINDKIRIDGQEYLSSRALRPRLDALRG